MASNKYANKKQHFVPACYLKAWLDPEAPRGAKAMPYLWMFDRDGRNPRNKPPEKIFRETDMYTQLAADGTRDLRLEHGLSGLEGKFTAIRTSKFNFRRPLTDDEWTWMCFFVTVAHVRTPALRDHMWDQFRNARTRIEEMMGEVAAESAPPTFPPAEGRAVPVTPELLDSMVQDPLPMMLSTSVQAVLPILLTMQRFVYWTDDPLGFITSDNPCMWFDPTAHRLPPMRRGVGIQNRNIEITMPLSPQQCIVFSHSLFSTGYVQADRAMVDAINHRHAWYAPTTLIACRNEVREEWFEQTPLPPDAWENTHGRAFDAPHPHEGT